MGKEESNWGCKQANGKEGLLKGQDKTLEGKKS
jgi:hypothetical protein